MENTQTVKVNTSDTNTEKQKDTILFSTYLLRYGNTYDGKTIFPERENSDLIKKTVAEMIEDGYEIEYEVGDDDLNIGARANLEVSRRILEVMRSEISLLQEKEEEMRERVSSAISEKKPKSVVGALTHAHERAKKELDRAVKKEKEFSDTLNNEQIVSDFLKGKLHYSLSIKSQKSEKESALELIRSKTIGAEMYLATASELLKAMDEVIEYADRVLEKYSGVTHASVDDKEAEEVREAIAQSGVAPEEIDVVEGDIVIDESTPTPKMFKIQGRVVPTGERDAENRVLSSSHIVIDGKKIITAENVPVQEAMEFNQRKIDEFIEEHPNDLIYLNDTLIYKPENDGMKLSVIAEQKEVSQETSAPEKVETDQQKQDGGEVKHDTDAGKTQEAKNDIVSDQSESEAEKEKVVGVREETSADTRIDSHIVETETPPKQENETVDEAKTIEATDDSPDVRGGQKSTEEIAVEEINDALQVISGEDVPVMDTENFVFYQPITSDEAKEVVEKKEAVLAKQKASDMAKVKRAKPSV